MDKVSEDLCKVDNYKGHVNRAVCCTEDGVVIAGSDYRFVSSQIWPAVLEASTNFSFAYFYLRKHFLFALSKRTGKADP